MSEVKNKILVIGATGTVGSEVVKQLVAKGEVVRAATRDPSRDLGAGAESVRYDFDDAATFDAALEGVDRIFYLTRPADPVAAAVAKPLFEKAAAHGVKHIVNMSALGIEGDEDVGLRQVEILLEGSGIPHTLLRPNWFMQNFTVGFMGDMARGQNALYLPAGTAAFRLVDTRDIAAVAAHVLTEPGHAGKTYNLCGPEAFGLQHVAAILSEATGRGISYAAITEDQMKSSLLSQGWPEAPIEFMLKLFAAVRNGNNAVSSDDIDKVLGHPARTFADFVQEYSKAL